MKFFDRFGSHSKILKYFLIAVVVTAFAALFFSTRKYYSIVQKYRYDTVNKYKREINELITEVEGISDNLYKAYLCEDNCQTAKVVSGIYSDTAFAASSLNNLPSDSGVLENCVKFINQVGDYSASSALKVLDEKELADEERKTFLEFAKYSESLLESLVNLSDNINAGHTDLSVFANVSYKENPFTDTFSSIKESFGDYESPKYDGKYSGSLKKPADYTGYPSITAEDTIKIVNEKMGQNIKDYNIYESQTDTAGKLFNINFKNGIGNEIYAAVTEKAGVLISYDSQRIPSGTNYSLNDAIEAAKKYVTNNGFSDLSVYEYEIYENIATVFLVDKENDVIYYPATVKLKVALDNLEILYIDYSGYLNMLNNKTNLTHNYTDEEVRAKLSDYQVTEINKAVISDSYKYDYPVYEAKVNLNDKKFLIYLSGENLKQEGISIVTENNLSRYVQ